MGEINTGAKMAVSICVICFILAMGMTIVYIARAFWNNTEKQIERPVNLVSEATAWQLASYNKPVPITAIWKVMNDIDPLGDTGKTTCRSFVMKKHSGAAMEHGTTRKDIKYYIEYKAWFSYEMLADGTLNIVIELDA